MRNGADGVITPGFNPIFKNEGELNLLKRTSTFYLVACKKELKGLSYCKPLPLVKEEHDDWF